MAPHLVLVGAEGAEGGAMGRLFRLNNQQTEVSG